MSSNNAAAEVKTAQIIQFPFRGTFNHTTPPEEIQSNLFEMKVVAIEDALSFIVPTLFEALLTTGFKLQNERLNSTLVALLRGIMYEHYGLPHPLTHFIEQNNSVIDQLNKDQITTEDLDDEILEDLDDEQDD